MNDTATVSRLFEAFAERLGPVGAAKALHLLSPRFFPIWDAAIAKAYGLGASRRAANARRYLEFMRIVQATCARLGGEKTIGRNPLKALDEFNYCKHTKQWM
jgi:hypothetical protein